MKSAAYYREVIKSGSRYAATELFRREQFIGEIYDPWHSDDGIIEAGLINRNATFVTSLDFLSYDKGCTNIVAEPRPEQGVVFARKGLTLVTSKVALLLPVTWMTTPETKRLFDDTQIARIYILTKRLRFRKYGNRLTPMAWYLWEKGHFDATVIHWI